MKLGKGPILLNSQNILIYTVKSLHCKHQFGYLVILKQLTFIVVHNKPIGSWDVNFVLKFLFP